jgi:hypothetical protein
VRDLQIAIESAISQVPIAMDTWANRSMIKDFEINDVNDFVYGYVMGFISNAFHYIVFISEGRRPTEEEVKESERIVSESLKRIRQSISRERYRIRMSR